jgi:hypothetical protein
VTDKLKYLVDKSILGSDNTLTVADVRSRRSVDCFEGYPPDREQRLAHKLLRLRGPTLPGMRYPGVVLQL